MTCFRLCCIAPVLVAKVLPGCKITVGFAENDEQNRWQHSGTAGVVTSIGAKHIDTEVTISFFVASFHLILVVKLVILKELL